MKNEKYAPEGEVPPRKWPQTIAELEGICSVRRRASLNAVEIEISFLRELLIRINQEHQAALSAEKQLGLRAVEEANRQIEALQKRNTDLCAQLAMLNTPEIHDFIVAVEREAKHQRLRWGSDHDAGKADADWFWLIGYLAGKALHKPEKQLHHIITTAAACLNWHAAKVGTHTAMRPGIEPPAEASRAAKEPS